MARTISILFLVIAGVFLIFKGANTFQLHQDAQTVATEYVRAVMTNDHAYIIALTHPDLRQEIDENQLSASEVQDPDEYRILVHHVKDTGTQYALANMQEAINSPTITTANTSKDNHSAKVHLVIEKDGYQLKPDVYLEQVEEGTWYVTFVEGLQVDPRWTDQQITEPQPVPEPAVETDPLFQETVEEIRTKFENREGVSVTPGI